MNTIFHSIAFLAIIIGSFSNSIDSVAPTPDCLSVGDAEKILGARAKQIESSSEERNHIVRHKCTYAGQVIPESKQISNLYYVFERYSDPVSAHKTYTDILTGNESMAGQTVLNTIGDEAWFHTDKENFCLLIFRKKNIVVRIKVNKLTSQTSTKALQDICKRIASEIKG